MAKKFLNKILKFAGRAILIASIATTCVTSNSRAQTSYIDRFTGSVVATLGKQPVDAATTGAITLSGYQTVDGINLNQDYMRCLVKNQTDQTTNGIYVVTSSAWYRAGDFSGPSGVVSGQIVYDTGGSQAGFFVLTTPNPIQVDQSGGQSTNPSNINFSPYSFFQPVASSTTTNTIGTGTKNFTTNTGLNLAVGQYVQVIATGNPSDYMIGQVTAYTSSTGALTLNITNTGGSGSFSAWNIYISGATGATGATGAPGAAGNGEPWTVAGGTSDVITATYSPAISSLTDGLLLTFRANAANTTTTPSFSPNALTAHTITQLGGQTLVAGNITAQNAEYIVRYNLTNTRWELLNPTLVSTASLVLLSSQTASNSASVAFVSGITSTYKAYFFVFEDVLPAADSTLQVLFSANAGSTYDTSGYAFGASNNTSGTLAGIGGTNQSAITLSSSQGHTAAGTLGGYMYLFTPATHTQISYVTTATSSGGSFVGNNGAGEGAGNVYNAVKFQMSTGNITSGTFKMYGLN